MNPLFLGVARTVITPAVGGQLYGYSPDIFSESVEDDLTVTAFYFRQGETQALLLSATVCLIQTALADRILSLIEEQFAIPKTNCILSATHTHSGPNLAGESGWGSIDREYCETVFIPRLLQAVEQAVAHPQPVRMAAAAGDSYIGVNRRELNLENKVKLGQNPWGPFNPQMTLLSFQTEDGKMIANLIHYGCHGTAAGKNHEITRDWSGLMTDALEQQTGGITAFFNGPEGDVGPRLSNGKTVGDIHHVHELGAIAAEDALQIYKKISDFHAVSLSVSHKNLLIPLQKRTPQNEAAVMLEEYKDQTINIKGMIRTHLEQVITSYREGYADREHLAVPQTAIALGDHIFASFPYELFSEIGMRIDQALPQYKVLPLSNANGSEGYFVTEDAICRGGYEVNMFLYGHLQPFTRDGDFHIIKETMKNIQALKGE